MESDEELELEVETEPERFNVNIFGRGTPTTLTTSAVTAGAWILERLRQWEQFNGLDIQVVEGKQPDPPIATIQVCVEGQVLIYHMFNATSLPHALQAFITDPKNMFYGIDLPRKLRALYYQTRYTGRVNILNMGQHVSIRYKRCELANADVTVLASHVLGKRLVMPEVNPDWDRPVLDDEQVIHACVLAYVSHQLGRKVRLG